MKKKPELTYQLNWVYQLFSMSKVSFDWSKALTFICNVCSMSNLNFNDTNLSLWTMTMLKTLLATSFGGLCLFRRKTEMKSLKFGIKIIQIFIKYTLYSRKVNQFVSKLHNSARRSLDRNF